MAATLDTRQLARRFKEAGVPEAQAEVFLDAMLEMRGTDFSELVTKADLRAELAELRTELRTEIGRLERRMDALDNRLGGLEQRLEQQAASLDQKLVQLEQRLTIRLGSMIAAAVVLVGALVAIF